MGIFDNEPIAIQPSGKKTKVFKNTLTSKNATPQTLRFLLMFEDQILGKSHVEQFPNKILYSISDIEVIEEGYKTGKPCRWSDYHNAMTFQTEEEEFAEMMTGGNNIEESYPEEQIDDFTDDVQDDFSDDFVNEIDAFESGYIE